DLLIVIFLIVVIVVLAMFGLNSVELLVIGTVLAMLLGARLPRPPAFGRLGKVDDFHRGAQFDRSPSWFGHTLFIAAVAIEAVLLVIVLYDRFIR
ncbi:MAG TPA: hypothetical protein VGX78_14970, partial [Pirellulales bacterium]|nr:hypothetical protein [Pirellulales bacterium]